MRKHNVVVAVASIVLGGLILYFARDLSGYDEHGVPGENYWPSIIAWLFVALGGLQFLELWLTPKADADKSVDLYSSAVRIAYVGAAVSALYGALLLAAGFVAATLVFVPAMMAIMGERRVAVMAIASVSVVVVIYVFFTQVFNTTLPVSVFFE